MLTRREVLRYNPAFAKQAAFHLCDRPIKVAVCGVRSGKTKAGSHDFIDKAILQPGYQERDIVEGRPYTLAVGAPTFPMIDRVILPTILGSVPPALKLAPYHQTKKLLRLQGMKGETWVYFISAKHPESWEGQDLHGLWIDEFAQIKEKMFDEAQTRTSNQKGWILLTGTPKGPGWAKKRLHDPWKEGSSEIGFFSWRTVDNPYYPQERIAYYRKTMPERYFKRTFEASWDAFEGQVYEDFADHVHIASTRQYTFHVAGRRVGTGPQQVHLEKVCAGVDWGYAHNGSIIVGGQDKAGNWWIVDESYGRGVEVVATSATADSWVKRARVLRGRWGIAAFYCGPDQPAHISSFKKAGLPARKAENAVQAGIQECARWFRTDDDTGRTGIQILDRCKGLREELPYYHWRVAKGGEQTEEPEKVNDDAVDGFRYLIYTYAKRGSFRREPNFVAA